MNKIVLTLALAIISLSSFAGNNDSPIKTICFFDDIQKKKKKKFSTIKTFREGKNGYGSTSNIEYWVARYANKLGGNAVINFSASQSFGFWPWQIVRPLASGTIISWKDVSDPQCVSKGGRAFHLSGSSVEEISYNEAINSRSDSHAETAQENKALPSKKQPDVYDQLERLDALRQKGIITDEEFQREKEELLSNN